MSKEELSELYYKKPISLTCKTTVPPCQNVLHRK